MECDASILKCSAYSEYYNNHYLTYTVHVQCHDIVYLAGDGSFLRDGTMQPSTHRHTCIPINTPENTRTNPHGSHKHTHTHTGLITGWPTPDSGYSNVLASSQKCHHITVHTHTHTQTHPHTR